MYLLLVSPDKLNEIWLKHLEDDYPNFVKFEANVTSGNSSKLVCCEMQNVILLPFHMSGEEIYIEISRKSI